MRKKIFARRAKHIYLEHCTQELIEAYIPYNEVQFSQLSALDVVFVKPFIALAHVNHSLCSPDLLMNI